MTPLPHLKRNLKFLKMAVPQSHAGHRHQTMETMVNYLFKCHLETSQKFLVQFNAVGFAGNAFPQTIYLSATVLACDINEANSCAAQGCTACGTGYAPTGRKRRSAEHGEVN